MAMFWKVFGEVEVTLEEKDIVKLSSDESEDELVMWEVVEGIHDC